MNLHDHLALSKNLDQNISFEGSNVSLQIIESGFFPNRKINSWLHSEISEWGNSVTCQKYPWSERWKPCGSCTKMFDLLIRFFRKYQNNEHYILIHGLLWSYEILAQPSTLKMPFFLETCIHVVEHVWNMTPKTL